MTNSKNALEVHEKAFRQAAAIAHFGGDKRVETALQRASERIPPGPPLGPAAMEELFEGLSKNDNTEKSEQPAFPQTVGAITAGGMTLRQWYAGQALIGILANSENVAAGAEPTNSAILSKEFPTWLAKTTYRLADAMIAEGEK